MVCPITQGDHKQCSCNLCSYPPHNHHCSDDVYWTGEGHYIIKVIAPPLSQAVTGATIAEKKTIHTGL